MTNLTDDFDAIAKAIESGDDAALGKLMAHEESENTETVEAEESAPSETPGDDADPVTTDTESEDSPDEEVDNGETKTEPVTEATSTNEAAPTAASPATAVDETEELKRELQRYKSDAGRVPYIQRRMAELERELRAYKARETQTTQGVNVPKVTTDGVELDEETKKQIEELREVDPVMAKTMERVAKAAIAGSKAQVDHAFTSYTQAEQEEDDYRFLMEQKQELLREVPRADEIFATNEWKQWKSTLTPNQRAMAESSYAVEVKQAIYAFAAAMQAAQSAAPVQATPVAATPTPASTEVSDKIKEARARKVSTSAEVKTSSAKKSVELDEDAYFREMYEKIGRENHLIK